MIRTPQPAARRAAPALAAVSAAALLLTACGGSSASEESADGLNVVATTTQLTDFTAQVGGDDISLTGLLQAGASAHHFDPSPADLVALSEADVLVVNGAGLEEFLDSAIESSGFSGTVITAADGIDLDEAKQITAEAEDAGVSHDHDHDSDDESSHEHSDDESESAEADHDHGDLNPHMWTSPRNAEGMVEEIADGLAAADPDHADDYAQRAAAYGEQLQALDTWVSAQMERVPEEDRVVVSGHDSLRYFLHDYDITFAGSILPSFEDNAEPSAAEIDVLVAEIKEHGVKAIFVESSMSPKLAQTIAEESGAQVIDAESLYADSLSADAGSGEGVDEGIATNTYIGATIHNTRVMLEAWGVEPGALPETLQG